MALTFPWPGFFGPRTGRVKAFITLGPRAIGPPCDGGGPCELRPCDGGGPCDDEELFAHNITTLLGLGAPDGGDDGDDDPGRFGPGVLRILKVFLVSPEGQDWPEIRITKVTC